MTTTCYHEGVGADARAVIDRVVARARAEVAGADQLRFEVVPAPAINIDGKLCFGAFSPELSLVLLAGEPPEPDITRAEWLETMLPEVISHELAHLEQHRDGRRLQERGVAVRARSLARRLDAGFTVIEFLVALATLVIWSVLFISWACPGINTP